MPDVTVMPDTPPVPPVAPTAVTAELLERSMNEIHDDLARATATPAGLVYAAPAHPLAEYRSLVDYADAVWSNKELGALLNRALVDQITTDQPGVVPPGWVNTVYGIMDQARPLIEAFGTEPLPPAGMDVNWPYFDGNLLDLVGEQATEKSSITSVKVILEKGSADLHTLAGGSDLSLQLIRRSQPSYRDSYLRIMFAAYAAVSDEYAGGMMLAVPGRGHVALDPLTANADALRGAIFAASGKVRNATGSPATFVLASSDVFGKIGALPGLFPAPYGTSNVAGTADASSLRINVSGIEIVEDPFLPPGSLHASNSAAGSWFEEGPQTISALDVDRLGENVAVWGMGTFGATVPAGIVQISPTAPAGTAGTRSRKSADSK